MPQKNKSVKKKTSIYNLYEKWAAENVQEGSSLLYAINKTDKLNPKRSEDCQFELINQIMAVCFIAANYGAEGLEDWSKQQRVILNSLKKEIPVQEKALNKLTSFIKKFPDVAKASIQAGMVGKKQSMFLKDDIDGMATLEFLNAYLSAYKDGLNECLQSKDYSPIHCLRVVGALEYPTPLKKQTYRKNPELNSLLFNLTFLFRHYTNKEKNDAEWFSQPFGEMPTFGKPCYAIVTDFACATLPNFNLGEKEVAARVNYLALNKVQLNAWVNTRL